MNYGLMIDCESLGIANNAVILSVGMIGMDMDQLEVIENFQFYERLDAGECQRRGMTIDASTVEWWMRQDQAAREEVFGHRRGHPVSFPDEAASHIFNWINNVFGHKELNIWSNGNRDVVWLENLFKVCGVEVPWAYHQVRDFRTMIRTFGHLIEAPPDRPVAHHALEDAKWQAEALLRMLRMIRHNGVAV